MKKLDSSSILERVKSFLKVKTDDELGIRLGKDADKAASAVRNWRSRNNLPFEVIVEFAIANNLSLDWLIFGKESQTLDEMEQGLLNRFKTLDFDGKLAVLNVANNKSAVGLGGVSQNANGNVGNMVGGNQTGSQRVQIFDLNEDD